ncbi:hypothetical protein [Nocardioides sp. SYSU D00038]|uniref:hypothetical protein n=1 Tax=Nocardioides sp. SYSU D00038 TaxID=2812554 RepID=UPI0019672BC5|nr:hypothetical protein [Nocardioides sp. SYSU D00038]
MADPAESYPVVLLVEQALSDLDARQVRSLHEGLDQAVTYHVLLPVEDAAARIEAAMGTLSTGELLPGPAMNQVTQEELDAVREESRDNAAAELSRTLAALTSAGVTAVGETVVGDPVEALASAVQRLDGREAIILTRPHVVAEFFHVDWSSRARRALGVPVLHLLEHESFDEQAGGGEGVTGV